jgi:TolB-like protein/DNA-binding winged helix-turn-helix (wHTH) protein/Tfp pilus assembly protein PilF
LDSVPPAQPLEPAGFRVGDLLIDLATRRVTRAGTEIPLSSLSFDLLLELARAAPAILTFEQIMQRVWPRLVVGPETVTQRIKVMREALDDDASDPKYIAGVRGRGYRMVAPVTSLPSPLHEPPPVPPPAETSPPSPAVQASGATKGTVAWMAGALAFVLLLGYVVIDRFGPARPIAPTGRDSTVLVEAPVAGHPAADARGVSAPSKSIAVLPFVDLSGQKDQEYFSDGIADEVIDLLTRVPGLQVSARTSSFSFKGQHLTIAEIGKTLRVANVLEGSVRRSGDRVRVTAQLVGADTGYSRWSQKYDRKLDDILKVQDEIAGAVARALDIELGSGTIGNRAAPVRNEAYALALEGRYFLERHTPADYAKATVYYQRALDLDPSYASAWAGYARATLTQGDLGTLPWNIARVRARDAAERALRLDPKLPGAHLIMSELLSIDEDWAAAARELDAAVAIEPGSAGVLLTQAGWTDAIAGRPVEAIGFAEQAVMRDPLMPMAHYRLCWIYFDAGRLPDATAACRETLELSPDFAGARFALASLLLANGQPDAALAEIEHETDEAFRSRGLAIVHYRLGRRADSDAALAALISRHSAKRMLFIASVYAARGEADAAFEWLRRARTQRENQLYEITRVSLFGPLRGDPRYGAFLRLMKLPA